MSPSALTTRARAVSGLIVNDRRVFDHSVLCRRLEDIDKCRLSLAKAYGKTLFSNWREHDRRSWRHMEILREEARAAANATFAVLLHAGMEAEAPRLDPVPQIRKMSNFKPT